MDVESTTANRTQEAESTKTMVDRVEDRFGIKPKRLIGDTAYGTAAMLNWIVEIKQIEPHTPVWQKYEGTAGMFGMADLTWDAEADRYLCPAGKLLQRYRRNFKNKRTGITKLIPLYTVPRNTIAEPVNTNHAVVLKYLNAKSPGVFTSHRAKWPVQLHKHPLTRRRVDSERRWRCCLRI